jgi:methyl-accepting chemotaxis protein
MSFRRSAPAALIAAIVVVIAAVTAITVSLFSGLVQSVEAEQFKMMKSIVSFNLKGAENRALARAEMIADLPMAQQLLAARDRPRMLNEFGKMFQGQKAKYGVDQAQFHLAPHTSFLRLQAPDQHSDDLSKFRPMVVAVNQDRVARKGLAIARTGPAIFGVVPVADEAGQHLGSFEFGLDFGAVLASLKEAYGLELAVFIEEGPLRQFARGLGGDVLNDANRVGKYMKFHSTRWELMKGLTTAEDLVNVTDAAEFTREISDVTYGVLLLPLRNSGGEQLGVIAVARDFSASRGAAGKTLVWQITLALFAIIVLAGVVLVVLRGFVTRPLEMLNTRFSALAAGDRTAVVDAPESLSTEMQDLARSHEELRVGTVPSSAVKASAV